ncbi:MAG: rhodanese-like domain-containing protein [Campylobacter sp.]|nr:rhodanese-like domain-containing protein [Campylobacter sp.]
MRVSTKKTLLVAFVLALPFFCKADETTSKNAVMSIIKENKLEVVNYDYALSKFGNGTKDTQKAVFIDARPLKKFESGTIPSSIQINDSEFDEQIKRIDKVAKDDEIVVFCQGWECQKSANVAARLKKLAYTKVKLYQAGYPDWAKNNYVQVGANVVKNAIENNSAMLIDARPNTQYKNESIASAINVPDTQVDELVGRFPSDKNTRIIVFSQGNDCKKAHVVAQKLVSLAYKKVMIYADGLPAWKANGLKTTRSSCDCDSKNEPKAPKNPFLGPIKKGLDEGTVDPQWFLQNYKNLPKDVSIVDVRKSSERGGGYLPFALNVSVEENDVESFAKKLPKGYVIFHCTAGSRALEAYQKAKKAGLKNTVYLDAAAKCVKDECEFTPNEALDPVDW